MYTRARVENVLARRLAAGTMPRNSGADVAGKTETMDDARVNTKSSFTTTHWSVVLQAGSESSPHAQNALESLCKSYRYPLYVHVRRLGWGPEDAEDLTHQFLVRFI